MRMMEFSSEQVTGDTKETMILLFILLVFACMASYHVFTVGMKDGKRSQYELVLRCILIFDVCRASGTSHANRHGSEHGTFSVDEIGRVLHGTFSSTDGWED